MLTSNKSRKNLIIVMMIIFTFLTAITIRVGWIQIVKGSEYKEMALQQQTKDTPIEAERGIIYDRNGEKLAVSVKCYTVYATPSEIGKDLKGDKKAYALDQTAQKLADILDVEKAGMEELLAADRNQIRIIGGIDADTADKIRDEKLSGITISNDTKRQ